MSLSINKVLLVDSHAHLFTLSMAPIYLPLIYLPIVYGRFHITRADLSHYNRVVQPAKPKHSLALNESCPPLLK